MIFMENLIKENEWKKIMVKNSFNNLALHIHTVVKIFIFYIVNFFVKKIF